MISILNQRKIPSKSIGLNLLGGQEIKQPFSIMCILCQMQQALFYLPRTLVVYLRFIRGEVEQYTPLRHQVTPGKTLRIETIKNCGGVCTICFVGARKYLDRALVKRFLIIPEGSRVGILGIWWQSLVFFLPFVYRQPNYPFISEVVQVLNSQD